MGLQGQVMGLRMVLPSAPTTRWPLACRHLWQEPPPAVTCGSPANLPSGRMGLPQLYLGRDFLSQQLGSKAANMDSIPVQTSLIEPSGGKVSVREAGLRQTGAQEPRGSGRGGAGHTAGAETVRSRRQVSLPPGCRDRC